MTGAPPVLMLLFLASCGFSPLHDTGTAHFMKDLTAIDVQCPEDVAGYHLCHGVTGQLFCLDSRIL